MSKFPIVVYWCTACEDTYSTNVVFYNIGMEYICERCIDTEYEMYRDSFDGGGDAMEYEEWLSQHPRSLNIMEVVDKLMKDKRVI